MAESADVLKRLTADLAEVLGDDLLSLVLHGSWALGDLAQGRSDLDVLAVMTTDPTAATLAGLDAVHARLAMGFPEWNGRVEVDYVSAQAVQAVVQGTDESHLMIRISPGEPLHEVEASRHYVLNWAAALQADRPIAGAAPSTVLPAIDRRLIHQVVLQHVRAWPEWVHDTQATGAQAYAVLTLCRAAETLATGRQVSKLVAAKTGRSRFPEWSALIDWAQDWWYHGGSDLDHGRFEDVRRFVKDVSTWSLRHYDIPDSSLDSAEPRL
jgi:hypothetical protein